MVSSVSIVEHGSKDSANQEEKEILQKILNHFSNAGYIRANFSGLSSFDKVAGGLMWCITGSDNLVNIGLIFGYGEELNIKKKILLSERIINALLHTTKRCPVLLHPHQIMGLDVERIIILVQWLLEQNYKFGKIKYSTPKSIEKIVSLKSDPAYSFLVVIKNILFVLKKYQPIRKYKLNDSKTTNSFDECFNEYANVTVKRKLSESNDSVDARKTFRANYESIYPIDFDDIDIADSDDELRQNHYDRLSEELRPSLAAADDKETAVKEMEKFEEVLESLQKEYVHLSEEISHDMRDLEFIQNMNSGITEELGESERYIKSDENYEDILRLVNETKSVRDEFSSLRTECIEKQKQERDETVAIEDTDFTRQINNVKELNAEIAELENKLAEEDKEINELESLLDQPGPAELAMYQRRFVELYDQIAANTIETKQFYDLHNTLIDSKHYIEKEINLLNSVLDNYPRAMSSANYREQFFNQLEGIIEWVTQTKSKINLLLSQKKEVRDGLHQQWTSLMELEREYATVVSQLNSFATPERKIE